MERNHYALIAKSVFKLYLILGEIGSVFLFLVSISESLTESLTGGRDTEHLLFLSVVGVVATGLIYIFGMVEVEMCENVADLTDASIQIRNELLNAKDKSVVEPMYKTSFNESDASPVVKINNKDKSGEEPMTKTFFII